jgi:hypothetical protein
MYRKSFTLIMKLVSLILILSCSILFTDIASSQIKDESGNPTTNTTDSSDDSSNTFIYVGIAAVMVIVAIALLVTNKDKKTESGKNTDKKDSTGINKIENLQIKKKDKFDRLDDELILNYK